MGRLVGLVVVVLAVVLGLPMAPLMVTELSAQELPGVASGLECGGPVSVRAGVGIDCTISFDRPLPDGVEAVAVHSSGFRTRCRSDGTFATCPDVGEGHGQSGEQVVRLVLTAGDGLESEVAAASFVTDEPGAVQLDLGLAEPAVFDGHPLEVSPESQVPVPRVFLAVRARGDDEVLTTLPVAGLGGPHQLDVPLPVGRYRAWPCVGFYAETCTEMAGGHAFQVIDPDPVALLPGHNRRSAERINVLFVASGFDVATLPVVARTLLTLDGPIATDTDLLYGPMAIEPLASDRDRFNFWLLPEEVADEQALMISGSEAGKLDGLGLPNLQVTTLYVGRTVGVRPPTDSRTTSFYGRYEVPPTDRIGFGGVRLALDPIRPHLSAPTLAHEWGHGLFSLRDEYNGFDDRGATTRYPNCAPDRATAESWWGDDVGRVDPFVYDVIEARSDAGLRLDNFDKPLVELVRVDLVAGGCLGPAGSSGAAEAIRPTTDSIMNSELPVFGSVNRRRVEEVLAQFSGRGVADHPEDLVISCVTKDERLACDGRLRSHLDPPEAGIAVGRVECQFDDDVEPVAVSCDGPAPDYEVVTLSVGLERGRLTVINIDPLRSDAPIEGEDVEKTGEPPPEIQALAEPAAQESMSRFWAVLGGTLALAAGLITLGRRQRQ